MATAVSVIVPVHNEENMLKRTLTSILMLNANEWLFILDRCEDRSQKIIQEYAEKLDRNIKFLVVNSKSNWSRHVNFLYDLGVRNASSERVYRTAADIVQDYNSINRYLTANFDMVSFAVYPAPQSIFNFWNLFTSWTIRHMPFLRKVGFSGTFVINKSKYFQCPLKKEDKLLFDTLLYKRFKEKGFTYCFVDAFNRNLRSYVKEKRYGIGVARARLKQPMIKVLLLSIARLMPQMFVGYWHARFRRSNVNDQN